MRLAANLTLQLLFVFKNGFVQEGPCATRLSIDMCAFHLAWHSISEVDDSPAIGLVDMCYEPRSPLTVALQYLAGLLFGMGSRVRLLWQSHGFTSFAQWCTERPGEMREFRLVEYAQRASLAASARKVRASPCWPQLNHKSFGLEPTPAPIGRVCGPRVGPHGLSQSYTYCRGRGHECGHLDTLPEQFRRLVLVVIAALHRRHKMMYDSMPWMLCILCDLRIPEAVRQAVADLWDGPISPEHAVFWGKRYDPLSPQ
jgi:hypothetical protein